MTWAKYGHSMLPGAFLDKVTPKIVFTDEAVVQCDVPVKKNTFEGAGNLQMITNKSWYKHLWHVDLIYYCFRTHFCV